MILNKLKDFVGISEHDEYEEEYEEMNWQQAQKPITPPPLTEEIPNTRRSNREALQLTNEREIT